VISWKASFKQFFSRTPFDESFGKKDLYCTIDVPAKEQFSQFGSLPPTPSLQTSAPIPKIKTKYWRRIFPNLF